MAPEMTLEEALQCFKCKQWATCVRDHHDPLAYEEHEISIINCSNSACKEKSWFYCNSCKKRFYIKVLKKHSTLATHQKKHGIEYSSSGIRTTSAANTGSTSCHQKTSVSETQNIDNNNLKVLSTEDDLDIIPLGFGPGSLSFDASEIDEILHDYNPAKNETENFYLSSDPDFTTAPIADPIAAPPLSHNASIYPKISQKGNERLMEAFNGTSRAVQAELELAFNRCDMKKMKTFWSAELGNHIGRGGGGMMYLVAKAFQQCEDESLTSDVVPDINEALFQFLMMIQYQSMNEKQKQRQVLITRGLAENIQGGTLLQESFAPEKRELSRLYGSSSKYSMWNNLPCPEAKNVGGVAYVAPKAIIAFALANGIPMDDIIVTNASTSCKFDGTKRVNFVGECRKAVNWTNSIKTQYYGALGSKGAFGGLEGGDEGGAEGCAQGQVNGGAQVHGAPMTRVAGKPHPTVMCLWLTDWEDGFGPGKVKSNRNNVDCKTLTISPVKNSINATDNTFPVAIGLKKAPGWRKVQRMYYLELQELTSSPTPILFYHGGLQKVIPVFIRQMASITDKMERDQLTSTIGCSSGTHRCFGVSGKITTQLCDTKKLQATIKAQDNSKIHPKFGWSSDCLEKKPKVNGGKLPACRDCRQRNLEMLGMVFKHQKAGTICNKCTNWDLFPDPRHNQENLDFIPNEGYPTWATPESPIAPPNGYDTFEKGAKLSFQQISYEQMKQACKFAFFQASRPGKVWTQKTVTTYLKHVGVSNDMAIEVAKAAKKCRKEKRQDEVNYELSESIHTVKFPGSWLCKDICLEDNIEAIMHLLFLGIAKALMELLMIWIKSSATGNKLGESPFLRVLQDLIADLRVFGLSWLAAYPLTGNDKKGSHGTGSWVSENWIFFTRISQFLFGWCLGVVEVGGTSKYGINDMSRMVIAFHAFVARCLTHGGVDDQYIKETEGYMKEFLSAVREFDIRVRGQDFGHKVGKSKKSSEPHWMKPNYMSVRNLINMMLVLGPLVLWWDGGGKGERYIQFIKPNIKRGVRDKVGNFFVNLIHKLYQTRQMELLEQLYKIFDSKNDNGDKVEDLCRLVESVTFDEDEDEDEDEESYKDDHSDGSHGSHSDDDDSCCNTTSSSEDEEEEEASKRDTFFTESEIHGMTKNKTFHVYGNRNKVNEAILSVKPLAGVIVVENGQFEFQIIHRKPVKLFVRRKVRFDDNNGIMFHGMWCASLSIMEEDIESNALSEIQSEAKMGAVAIPLRYVLGNDHVNSNKFCVVTNWWKYRTRDGRYGLPTLDACLYGAKDGGVTSNTTMTGSKRKFGDIFVRNGLPTMQV